MFLLETHGNGRYSNMIYLKQIAFGILFGSRQ